MNVETYRALPLLLLFISAWLTSCAAPAPRPLPPPPPAARPLSEEELKPLERVSLAITGHDEIPSPDGKTVTVTGTVANRGTKPTPQVVVHVEALNSDGVIVLSGDSEVTSEVIPPGGTASFSVKLENRADVDRYHVEALAR